MQNTIRKQNTWQFFKFYFMLQFSQGQMLLARHLLSVQNSMTSQFSLWQYICGTFDGKKEINVNEWINKTFNPIYFGRQTLSLIYFERRKLLQIIAKYTKRPWSLYFCTLRGGKIWHVVGTYIFWSHHYESWSHSNRRIRSSPSVCAARMWLRPNSTEQ